MQRPCTARATSDSRVSCRYRWWRIYAGTLRVGIWGGYFREFPSPSGGDPSSGGGFPTLTRCWPGGPSDQAKGIREDACTKAPGARKGGGSPRRNLPPRPATLRMDSAKGSWPSLPRGVMVLLDGVHVFVQDSARVSSPSERRGMRWAQGSSPGCRDPRYDQESERNRRCHQHDPTLSPLFEPPERGRNSSGNNGKISSGSSRLINAN